MSLDPDDPRPPYAQITNALRAAILTKKIGPGEQLPSQTELTKRYRVSRATVQRALRDLQDEGLIVSRQGSGAYVRSRTERPMELRPHIEQAFEADEVTIDFAGFSGETLYGAIREPVDRIRAGRLRPQSIHVRILVPDTRKPQALPTPLEAEGATDDVRARAHEIMRRNTRGITDSLGELETLGLIDKAQVSVRVHGSTPAFKLYLINRREAFFGFYPVTPNTVPVNGTPTKILDVMGLDTVLFPYFQSENPGRSDAVWIEQGQMWFDSMWQHLGEDYTP
ncbi:hypothetical protein GCM10027160_54980 [Streptomyces calidiresistens]|uniref:GntR family transcriptional regulator n=1 Tax=Streptomyces calidiresistens TaxID=1485586 RepID=A0A7W3SZN9_9ACTN|nr:winged helix-turn-helix domain-containing protein [Streptomyces calidiresistens]MBB0228243.1 GntR family transcriptional regulator [Streptomyces calidiresistens]